MFNGIAEKLIDIFEGLIQWMFDSIIEPFTGLATLKDLVFGKLKEGSLVWGTFNPSDLTDGLNPVYYSMATLSGFFIVSFIVLNGARIAGAPLNPQKRNDAIDFFKDLLLVGVVLINLPSLYDLLFTVNQAIVGMFNGAYESHLDTLNEKRSEESSGVLGYIFIQLILLGLAIWANFYYMMRKITLIILMGMGPMMLAFWMHPQFKPITSSWLKELTGSIFVQSIHAFVFWTVATISSTSTGFIETVIVYLIFIPISESVRRLLLMGGDMQGGLSKAGAMLGMGALAGMYGAVKGAVGDKSVMSAIKGAYSGINKAKEGNKDGAAGETKDALGALPGSDIGTTTQAEKMLKAGDIFSKGGKAVLGMAGAIAGSPMGPVASIMGATAGSELGGVVGGLTGRVGASALQGIANRGRKGIDAFKEGGIGKNSEGFDENLANELADRDTASWADTNKASEMNRLRELHPDATPEDLESKFNSIKAQKRAGFYQDAKSAFTHAKQDDGKFAKGGNLVDTSSQAMVGQWANDNQNTFFDNYNKTNPQQEGESLEDFQARRMNAFINKKNEMRVAFASKGNEIISEMGAVDGNQPIDKAEFSSRLGSAISNMSGIGNAGALSNSVNEAVSHVQGENTINPNGKGNSLFLASRMANARTQQMGQQFINEQAANGVDKATAQQMWEDKKPVVHRDNLNHFYASAESANSQTFSNGFAGKLERLGDIGVRAGDALAAGTGVRGFIQGTSNFNQAVQSGMKEFSSSMAVATNFGQGGFSSHIQGFKQATSDGIKGTMASIVEQNGGAIETQANMQNMVGYASGMVFGTKGYQVGKSAVARFSPLKQVVQDEIKAPSEVIQMAQTITDDHGNQKIAPGAIRQVITPNESYVEVRTKSGETQVVSRKGSGHSGLRKGDVVYQDLEVQGDSLVVASQAGGGSSTYRLDSGGGRVPSSIQVNSNPNELLGSPRISPTHQPNKQAQSIPSYSQSVDSGQFYVEDLKSHGMENVQVVVEKNRQFVTAQKDGITYRVSPVFAGDTKLANSDSVRIPVTVQNNKLKPANPVVGSQVAVHSEVANIENSGYSTYATNPNTPYYSSDTVNTLLPSKAEIWAQRRLDKRQQLDQVRRKQGLLG